MIRIKIEATSTYRLAGQSCETDGYPWHGRLLNTPQLEKLGKATEAGNPVREIGIEIANSDAFINLTTETLWGATVTLYNDDYAETWVGEIRSFSTTGEGVLSIMAAEETLAAFKSLLPDEIVRVSTWTESARDAANTTIPTVFGGTAADPIRVRGILVDRVAFRYLLCVGEIREVVAVLKNREAITTGFTTYTGTAGQSVYPGFAYIEFDADPRDEAGTWPEILADVVGLKLGAATEEECRNPARILQYLLTTTRGGSCGWGLGIPSGSLDSTSFTTAISDCDTAGFKIDGALLEQKAASFWIAQITNACRGSLRVVAGKWTLTIDKISSSVAHYGDGQKKMRLQYFGKGASSERKNRHSLEYRYDATDGRLLGYVLREDSTSQTAIGVNESKATNLLVRDHTVAGYIVDYLSRYETYGENRIEFMTDDFDGVNVDSVITITRSDLGLSAAKFRVVSMRISGGFATIEARGYDDAIFDNDTPGTPPADPETDPTIPAAAPPNPPGVPADLSIQTNVRVQPDGTVIGYADVSFTPAVAALFTRIEVGEGAVPESWVELGVIGESGIYHHEPAKVGQNYTYRLTSVNAGGSSAPVTANVTIAADTTAPLVPQTPVLSTFFKSVKVLCKQNLTLAPDHQRFDVYRNTTDDSGTATKIGEIPCGGNVSEVAYLDEDTAFGETYYYWLKSADTSNNISGFSASAGPVSTQQIISGDIAAGALASSDLFACGVVDAAAIANCAVTAAKTCLAAIDQTSGCLTACSVATCNLQAGAITGEKIYAGAITGDKIAANTITASKLLIAAPGSALNEDPGFLDTSAWSEGSRLCTVTDGKVGFGVARSATTGTNFTGIKRIPFDPTKSYRARIWARKSATANGLLYAGAAFQDYLGCNIVNGGATYWYYAASDSTPGTSWTEYSAIFGATGCAAPATAKTMTPLALLNWGGTTGYHEIQDFRIEEVLPGTLIQDGAITTSKIIATGIDGACICAGSITTGHLSASGICADCIKAGTLSGVTVCACTGLIGGWSICGTYIMGAVSGTGSVGMFPAYPTIQLEAADSSNCTVSYMELGKMYWGGGWKNGFGYSMTRGSNAPPDIAFGIANKGSVVLPDSSTVDCMCPFFWIGDSSAHMKYYGGVLTVSGTLCSGNGTIGGWCICPNFIAKSDTNGDVVLWSQCNSVYTTGCISGGGYIQAMHGRIYDCRGIRCAVGYSFYKCGSLFTFATGIPLASGVVSLPDATTTYLTAGCPFFWVGDSSAYMKYYGGVLTVKGTVCATAGCFTGTITSTSGSIGGWTLGASYICGSCGTNYSVAHCVSLSNWYWGCSATCFVSLTNSAGNSYWKACMCGKAQIVQIDASVGISSVGSPISVSSPSTSCSAASFGALIYATGYCAYSDRLCKSNIRSVAVLQRLRELPLSEWSYSDASTRHIGPMAQDFYQQFPFYSDSPEAVGGLDGIALKAAQELDGCVGCLNTCVGCLHACICSLESRLANLEARLPACA